ncbi:MAG: polysaccharide pyruvyl transferase family protein [Candidatus Aminicenantes bacterium]|nr:polysaccharide pyruvyl transferase family protein [Candidatus Aminicenantes bacterium]
MKAFIVNTHSVLNSGDTGIVLAQIRFLKKHFPSLQISLSSRTPRLDDKIYSPLDVKLLPPLIPAPSIYSGAGEKIRECLKNLFNIRSKIAFMREIKHSNLVISSGGGYFWSHRRFLPGPMFLQNYLHIKLATLRRKPVIFFPQSFDPLRSGTAVRLIRDILEGESVIRIYAREELSAGYLKQILGKTDALRICPDMAFLLDFEDRDTDTQSPGSLQLKKPIIAMTLRQWDFPEGKDAKSRAEKHDAYLENLKETCRSVYEEWNGSVVLFCQSRGPGSFEDDRIITNKLKRSLKEILPAENFRLVDLPEAADPHAIMALLSQADFLIATRFHSAIFALIAGTPVISISYQQKSSGIMKTLGLERFDINISDFHPKRIIDLGEEILNHAEEIRKHMRQTVLDMRNAIEADLTSVIRPFLQQDSHEDSSRQ